MIKLLSIKHVYSLLVFLILGCTSSKQKLKDVLTNKGNGKYWDLVFQTDTAGNMQKVLKEKDSLAKECIYFFNVDSIHYYYNIDSTRVINMNNLVEDVRYDGNFKVDTDTIAFWGKKYKVLSIDSTTIELLDVTYGGKSIKKLKHSKLQNKIVCKDIYCSNKQTKRPP